MRRLARHHFEVVLPNGDCAESETVDGIMLAGRTLIGEAHKAGGSLHDLAMLTKYYKDGKLVCTGPPLKGHFS